MRTIVVDIDETLLISGKLSKILRWLARQLFKIALFAQKPNKTLINELKKYDKIIILTARGINYKELTEKQLRRHHIKYNSLIMCNYTYMIYQWKLSVTQKLKPTIWVDDIKDRKIGIEGYT
ncbi:MAG: hypothetical protein QXK93_04860 [Candidatus Bathyarchaeia archaeon]